MAKEIWKNCVGFPAYQVSSFGRVRTIGFRINNGKYPKTYKGWKCRHV